MTTQAFSRALEQVSIDDDRKRVALAAAMDSLDRNRSCSVTDAIALAICDAVSALLDYDEK